MNKYEDNLIIELINKDKAINALIPIMCKYSIEPDVQDEIILCLLNIKEDTEEEVKSIFEKATPKKPTNIESHEEHDLLFVSGKCPVCRDWVNDSMSYCDSCGQALDWSGEDE